MEFVSQELLPPTVASAAGLAVVETVDVDLPENVEPKTLVLAVFRGTTCAVYSVSQETGVKSFLFEDWVGCKVNLVASTCDGSLTCLTDDLTIVIFTFDLVRKIVLKRFQSVLPTDDKAKIVRRSFNPSLAVAPSSGGKFALCHTHEGYAHQIGVKLILSSEITTPFDKAIRRVQLARYSPYALSYAAHDHTQYIALYAAAKTSASSASSNRIGSNDFYTSLGKDRVALITQQTVVDETPSSSTNYSTAPSTARHYRAKGTPFLVSCLSRMNATAVVTDEMITLIVPEGGFASPSVPYYHGIPNLLENRVAVTSIFDMTPGPSETNGAASSTPSSSASSSPFSPSVILGLSDGRYYKIQLDNSADDCDSFSKPIDLFAKWIGNGAGVGGASSTQPEVVWNYGSMVRGIVAGVCAANGDVYLLKPSVAGVLPRSVGTLHSQMASSPSFSPSYAQNRLLRGVVTGVLPVNREVITSTSDGYIRRSQTVLDTEIVGELPQLPVVSSSSSNDLQSSISSATYHTIPLKAINRTTTATDKLNEQHTQQSIMVFEPVAVAVLTGVDATQFLLKTKGKLTDTSTSAGADGLTHSIENNDEEEIEYLFDNDNDIDNNNNDTKEVPSFITTERTLAFGFTSPTRAVQITPSGVYSFEVSITSSSKRPSPSTSLFSVVSLAVSHKCNVLLGYVSEDGVVAYVEKITHSSSSSSSCANTTSLKLRILRPSSSQKTDLDSGSQPSDGVEVDLSEHAIAAAAASFSGKLFSTKPLLTPEVICMCVMPSLVRSTVQRCPQPPSDDSEQRRDGYIHDDIHVVLAFWGVGSHVAVVSAAQAKIIGFVSLEGMDSFTSNSSSSSSSAQQQPLVMRKTLEVSAIEPLNSSWIILQLSNGLIYGRKIFSALNFGPLTQPIVEKPEKGLLLDAGEHTTSITSPLVPLAMNPRTFIPGTMRVCRALSAVVVATPTTISLLTVRTAGSANNESNENDDNGKNSHVSAKEELDVIAYGNANATYLKVVTERLYSIPAPFKKQPLPHMSSARGGTGSSAPLLSSITFWGTPAELMRRPQLLVAATSSTSMASPTNVGLTPAAVIVDLRSSYSHQVVDEIKVGASVTNIFLASSAGVRGGGDTCSAFAKRYYEKIANLAKLNAHNLSTIKKNNIEDKNEGNKNLASSSSEKHLSSPPPIPTASEPVCICAIVERPSVDPSTFPSSYSVMLIHCRPNKLSLVDEKYLPPAFIPSCSASSGQSFFPSGVAVVVSIKELNEKEIEEKGQKTVKKPAGSETVDKEPNYIVIGGCDISNGTGKLITVTTAGSSTFTALTQTSLNGPVNDLAFTVADRQLALVAATHFDIYMFKFATADSKAHKNVAPVRSLVQIATPFRTSSPVLSLASSLSVVAAVYSGLIVYYEFSVGCLRERAAEILPNATQTAIVGVDGHFVKCDSRRNLFVNVLAEKSKKVNKTDAIHDKYSIPLKAATRLQSWASKIIPIDESLSPIIDDEKPHISLNTAYEALFTPCGISKRFYICGSDGSLTVLVRIPSELYRFLLKLETCLETYLDHERRDYYISYCARENYPFPPSADRGARLGSDLISEEMLKQAKAQVPQAPWSRRDSKQCMTEARNVRSSNIVNLNTVNTTFFDKLSAEEKLVLVRESLQPDVSDFITPVSVAAVLQRCVATL